MPPYIAVDRNASVRCSLKNTCGRRHRWAGHCGLVSRQADAPRRCSGRRPASKRCDNMHLSLGTAFHLSVNDLLAVRSACCRRPAACSHARSRSDRFLSHCLTLLNESMFVTSYTTWRIARVSPFFQLLEQQGPVPECSLAARHTVCCSSLCGIATR
jgi:hypothetical protein